MKKNTTSEVTTVSPQRTHIVILGGGFGGVHTYKSLPRWVKNTCDITMVDKRNHFLFTPLLAELAGSSLQKHHVALPIVDVLGTSAEFIQDEIISIDAQNNNVTLKEHDQISYDFLVSALGANTFFYGTPGAQEHARVFKSLQDAIDLKNRCIDIFQQASELNDKQKQKELLTFMVIGGGPTGVEVVTEIAELMFGTLLKKYDNINKEDVSITVVNGGETILQMFDTKLSHYAEKSLIKENITLRNNVRIIELKKSSAITKDGEEIFAHTILWTAGVSAIDLNCSCGTFKKERGRIHISKDMRAMGSDNVFVLGDMALFPTEDGRGLPMTAQVARQQGQQTAKNITALIQGKTTKDFAYKQKGLLASLGSFNAIGQVSGMKFTGLFAWIIWRGVYLALFDSWKKRFSIMGEWFKNLFTKRDINRF